MLVSMIPEFDTHPKIRNQVLTTLHMLLRLNPRNILEVAKVDIAVAEFLKCFEDDFLEKSNVINLIGALVDVDKTRAEIIRRGGIDMIVRLLRHENTPTDVQGSSLEVLAKLAIDSSDDAQLLIEQKGLGVIFTLLQNTKSADVRCQLLRLLTALTFNNPRLQQTIREQGRLPLIMEQLESTNVLVQEYAVRLLLTVVAGDKKNKEHKKVVNNVDHLLALLDSKTVMVVKSTVRCISELSLSSPSNKDMFRKKDVLQRLVKLIDTSLCGAEPSHEEAIGEMINCTTTTYTLECIGVLCNKMPKNQQEFLKIPGASKKLMTLLNSSDLREAFHAITTFATVLKSNSKAKKEVNSRHPELKTALEQHWTTHKDQKVVHVARATLSLLLSK